MAHISSETKKLRKVRNRSILGTAVVTLALASLGYSIFLKNDPATQSNVLPAPVADSVCTTNNYINLEDDFYLESYEDTGYGNNENQLVWGAVNPENAAVVSPKVTMDSLLGILDVKKTFFFDSLHVDSLNHVISRLDSSYTSTADSLVTVLNLYITQGSELEGALKDKDSLTLPYRNQISSLGRQLGKKDGQLNELQGSYDRLQSRYGDLYGTVRSLEGDISTLQSQNGQLQQDLVDTVAYLNGILAPYLRQAELDSAKGVKKNCNTCENPAFYIKDGKRTTGATLNKGNN